ncbi:hypothetical protein ACXZ1M_20325 [Duganella sp. PWIR1]
MELLEIVTAENLATGRAFLRVPYEIRQNFKDTFATWKWHPDEKLWSVDDSEREKLASWSQLVKPLAVESADNTRRHLTAKQIERAEVEAAAALEKLTALRGEQDTLAALKVKLAQSLMVLQQRAEEVDAVEAGLDFERQEQARHQADINATLGRLIDLQALRKAVDAMTLLEASTNRRDMEEWRMAQLQIVIARNVMAEAGIRLEALDFLAESREPIRKMAPGAWFNLTRSRA